MSRARRASRARVRNVAAAVRGSGVVARNARCVERRSLYSAKRAVKRHAGVATRSIFSAARCAACRSVYTMLRVPLMLPDAMRRA